MDNERENMRELSRFNAEQKRKCEHGIDQLIITKDSVACVVCRAEVTREEKED